MNSAIITSTNNQAIKQRRRKGYAKIQMDQNVTLLLMMVIIIIIIIAVDEYEEMPFFIAYIVGSK